jgi:hypothetical protein
VLLLWGLSNLGSTNNFILPKSLVGSWTGNENVTVRFKVDGKFYFKTSSDSLVLNLTINENGCVSGNFNTANFENCTLSVNYGWFGRKLNLNTGYIITGELKGSIFPEDTISTKGIKFPITQLINNRNKVTIFQTSGMDVFPMVAVQLTKQERQIVPCQSFT